MKTTRPTMYLDPETSATIPVDELRRKLEAKADPNRVDFYDLADKAIFRPLRPDPDECNLLGYINGAPVIHATDLGESIQTDEMREIAFKLPGDPEVHRGLLDADCVLPRHRGGMFLPDGHACKERGYYIVLNSTSETFAAMKSMDEQDRDGEKWKHA